MARPKLRVILVAGTNPQQGGTGKSTSEGNPVKYLVQWSFPTETFRPAVERFLKSGGVPPSGVTLIGRWHGMSGKGCAVVESTDAKALFSYIAEWMEYINIEATPLVEDAEAAEALAPLYQ